MPPRDLTKKIILMLMIEMFFAILPLVILWASWPKISEARVESFWASPELSLTGCILYGLTLVRFLQGAIIRANSAGRKGQETFAIGYVAIGLFPLLGSMISGILVHKAAESSGGDFRIFSSILNLFVALSTFFFLGGAGIRMAEGGE